MADHIDRSRVVTDRGQPRKSVMSRRALLALSLGGIIAACSQAAPQEATTELVPPTPVPVASVTVRRGDLVESIIVNGTMIAARDAVLFFRQTARLKNIHVSTSDRVKSGQLLAELEIDNLDTSVRQAEITMRKLQAKLEQSRARNLDRYEVSANQIDYDLARLAYDQLRAQLAAAVLVAPFDGVITETAGRPGETINAFVPVVTVANPAELLVQALLPSSNDAGRLTIGQSGTLIFDKQPTVKHPLQLVQLPTNAATLANGTPVPDGVRRSFKLKPLEPLPKDVEMGALGRVTLILREKRDILLVKSTAVRTNGPRAFVQVIQQGRKREADVEVGIVTPIETEIVNGLREGDQVVDLTPGVATPAPGPTPRR